VQAAVMVAGGGAEGEIEKVDEEDILYIYIYIYMILNLLA
jgi:hypothetical protein